MHTQRAIFTALVCTLALPHLAQAASNLVQNGDFELTTLTSSAQMTASNVTGWTTSGYTMLFLPQATVTNNGVTTPNPSGTTADTTGATVGGGGNLKLWGPGTGSNNGLTVSPTGGNFIAGDGDGNFSGPISQTVTGLTVGNLYNLSFAWAAAQQSGFSGATTEAWTVTLGSNTVSTTIDNNATHGFVPWTQASFLFTATATSELLSFLAAGTPAGTPPFSLLDGVSLVAAPEPATWSVLLVAIAGLAVWGRRRAVAPQPRLLRVA